ncbi:hypothetical protein BMW23_0578 [Bodo saltans virus]|uniref:Uncharacterized protein n=1 Tax=Bodo saltans virus TaxID=2024608 RepID=A0A2H4UUW9_9VIRU|nr:hypothetical protein QJ851_gp0562 [Bodo saltans virus]ATZ80625.1 hypothetical protein BMW23_0578 [Bodo saltans virus]
MLKGATENGDFVFSRHSTDNDSIFFQRKYVNCVLSNVFFTLLTHCILQYFVFSIFL